MIAKSISHIKDIHSISIPEGKLLYKLAKQSIGNIVEIGSWKGYSTIWLANGSKDGLRNKVYAIDPHTGAEIHKQMYGAVDTYNDFLKNIKETGVSDVVIPIRLKSEDAVKDWDNSIGLLWIDGDHMAADKDFDMWYPFVKEGGIIALHDTTTWENPRKVAMMIYKSGKFKNISRVGSITYAIKTGVLDIIDILNNDNVYCRRCILQLLLPYHNKVLGKVAKLIGR
jgi:predicted O-methyltransferase YrrM